MRILSYIGGLLSTVIVKSELFPLPGGQRHKPGKGKSHGAKKKQGGGGVAGPGHGAQGDLILQNIVPLSGPRGPPFFGGFVTGLLLLGSPPGGWGPRWGRGGWVWEWG